MNLLFPLSKVKIDWLANRDRDSDRDRDFLSEAIQLKTRMDDSDEPAQSTKNRKEKKNDLKLCFVQKNNV